MIVRYLASTIVKTVVQSNLKAICCAPNNMCRTAACLLLPKKHFNDKMKAFFSIIILHFLIF